MLMVFLTVAALIVAAVISQRSLCGRSTVQVIGAQAGSFEGS